MSKYVDDMRQAITDYNSTYKAAQAKIRSIGEDYGEAAADRERERQRKTIEGARQKAEAAIREAYSEGVYLAEQWGKPNGSHLTDDIKLFDAGMVTPEVFETLKARYKDNATMSAALKAQGEKLNAAAVKEAQERGVVLANMQEPYKVRDIVTAQDKMEGWKNLKKQAMDKLDMIDHSGAYSDRWTRALANVMGEKEINSFGEGIAL